MRMFTKMVLATTLLASQMGHGVGGCCSEESVIGPRTQSVCPPTPTLTYENFGKPFMESYCLECHAKDKLGDARQGAPEFHDFETPGEIRIHAEHIDETSASGPAATNEGMPPANNPKPSLAERQMLGEYLQCVIEGR